MHLWKELLYVCGTTQLFGMYFQRLMTAISSFTTGGCMLTFGNVYTYSITV